MNKNTKKYLTEHAYHSNAPKELLEMMGERFAKGFENEWERFGYEIGGPVCYAFTKWISDEIESNHSDITDIIFIARDGYLLQKIYEMLPRSREIKTHYIYASRSVKKQCEDTKEHERYCDYLARQNLGKGTIATVDTVTMMFSGQRLIAESVQQPVYGFCWVVLDVGKKVRRGMQFKSYQSERYHLIRNWNVMEYIMTSPEPPVRALSDGKPIYVETDKYELQREAIFPYIEKGVIEFARDALRRERPLQLRESKVIGWVNEYLCSPSDTDRAMFENVMFSETEDHANVIPLNPFSVRKDNAALTMKDRIWYFSQRHPLMYMVLHNGKRLCKKAVVKGQKKTNMTIDEAEI